ncbi:DNA topoisomerase IV subunit A [bacterium]|nr:DNA topoisomerase IV subunit A [bacterium]
MSKEKTHHQDPAGAIVDVPLVNALSERYLSYALSTIMSRSLPDVRDGLKPVHRRVLYAMLQLKLDPASGYKKCARVVGDVIGKYHPHGDVAVYETMVRMAQSFALRYPLVDGQGNFGSIDGDNAAAMRYTEARMTNVAMLLLEDIENDTVDFRPTYDSSDIEPVLLSARFPNLLANGSEGIAVGMATSIPPHNVAELCDAIQLLIKKPKSDVADLMQFVKGPDFPTGGSLVEAPETILKAYETGRGSLRVRAKWEVEQLSHGLYQIVVTEIPYQVQKSRLIEKIAELFRDKKLALLGNIRDESTETIRIVFEPKSRNVEPEVLMESLFKLTELESRFALNLNVITSANVPKVQNLKDILQEYIDHRLVVLDRKSRYRLGKIKDRLEVLEGYLVAYLNLDEVIRIIREEDKPKPVMMERFGLTDNQAEAILNMRLRSLRKLEEFEIRGEHDRLKAEQAELEALLGSDDKRMSWLSKDVKALKAMFSEETEIGKRRTLVTDAPKDIDISVEAFVEKEPITVLCSKMGWVRAVKGTFTEMPDAKYKEGDEERFIIPCKTTDKLMFFASDGKCYTVPANRIPKGKGLGEPIRLMVDLPNEEDIVALFVNEPGTDERQWLVASSEGKGFRIIEGDMVAQTRQGRQVLNLNDKQKAVICTPVDGDKVAVIGQNRKLLVFELEEIPVMKRGQGVTLQKYKDGNISDLKVFKGENGLSWKSGERERVEPNLNMWLGKRASAGKLPPTGFPRNNKFA